jgi:hypothetical protein
MSLNINKTCAVIFSNRPHVVDEQLIVIGSGDVELGCSTKFLGVNIDSGLKFNAGDICNKLSRSVGIIYKLRKKLPITSLINLYYTFVYPYLLYCNLAWGGTFACHLQPLFLIQKKIIRIITDSEYQAHTNPLFYQTKILKVEDIHTFLLAQYAFKLKDGVNRNHDHFTRHKENIIPIYQRLSLTQHSVSYAAPKVFNELPEAIKNETSLAKFKVLVKGFLVNKYLA